MIENYLIKHCSPTLASLKTAGLFSFSYLSKNNLNCQIEFCNNMLNPKGVYVTVLKDNGASALIYVYRRKNLIKDLAQEGVYNLMKKYGYIYTDIDYAIKKLKRRFMFSSTFPHEIGLFLGYPLSDVIGFIEHSGKQSKATGYWKVYGDVTYAMDKFNKYNKCRRVYEKLYQSGTSIQKLTVTV
ncbi:MAG: DUF3793 family protein [Ruminococcus sp.]|nr:DUF3793 family protein [Ruminococcus sp.]